MKKSNVIITVVLAAVSIFLLALWYALGLNRVDEPLDLIVSIVWWAVIIVAIVAVVKVENTRRERVRTVYVANGSYYNSEAGNRILAAGASPQLGRRFSVSQGGAETPPLRVEKPWGTSARREEVSHTRPFDSSCVMNGIGNLQRGPSDGAGPSAGLPAGQSTPHSLFVLDKKRTGRGRSKRKNRHGGSVRASAYLHAAGGG